jgi:hypothetical protein
MPVRWQIDHATRTVVVTAEGALGLRGFEELLASMERVSTLSYRKLIDMTGSSTVMSQDDLIALSDRIGRESDVGPRGPVAVVAAADEHYEQARRFQAMVESPPHQRLKVFRQLQPAFEWLSAEPVATFQPSWLENRKDKRA